jgi:tRNA/tmRNA/rRNA uracil-C5-methylase (TrmA/RlmC/RlmD family)
MKSGDRIELRIDDLTSAGWGVGRISAPGSSRDAVIFVPGSAPGELVRAEITEERKNHFRAELVEIAEPSPSRIEPPCPYFSKCPGCSLQFLAYDAQCKAKAERVRRIFGRSFGDDSLQLDFIPSPQSFGYRTHLSIACERSGDGISIGFTDPATRRVVDIPACMLIPDWGNVQLGRLRTVLSSNVGSLNEPVRLRMFLDHAEKQVYVVHTRGPLKRQRALPSAVKNLLDAFPAPKTLVRAISGVRFRLHPASFVQANFYVTEALYRRALDKSEAGKEDVLLDLYSGNGFFTLALAPIVKEAVAIESDRRACDNLTKSADDLIKSVRKGARKRKGAEPSVTVAQGRAESLAPEVVKKFQPTVVIANPPRTGLHPRVLDALAKSESIGRIVIVSCDATTCVRDVKELMKSRFAPSGSTIVDCYPQTAHVEIVMPMSR